MDHDAAHDDPHRRYYLDLARRRLAADLLAAINDCLGRWVSELPPVLAYRLGSGEFLGLTADGHDRIYIAARRTAWNSQGT